MDLPKKGIYRHFKGKRYELIDFAKHSETLEPMVVYRALYGEKELWVRPLSMWTETVERDGCRHMRFMPEEEYLKLHSESQPDKLEMLKRIYGYSSFREGQEEVIDSILSGRDTLAILPTGAGKSICYQLPAQMLDGTALVISPLISLMKDQVNSLTQEGISAAYLNSSLTDRQFDAAINRMSQGLYRIVYVAPERLGTSRFIRVAQQLRISMVAVDEAHCISQWGQDFRPSYLEIPEFISRLPERPKLCAFTATATKRVREDIIRLLKMKKPFVKVTGFNRSNLYFSMDYTHEKDKRLFELLESYRGFSGIIYCATRKNVESVHTKLLEKGYCATRYHAGLSEEERKRNQEDFVYDRIPIMVATNAFGMGIDKSNVRFVIHYNMPKDIESYYQEAGRGGRDGERADCHLLYQPRDIHLQNFLIDKMGEESDLDAETLKSVQENARFRLNAMADYCRTTQCLRRTILRYFGEEFPGKCDYCINCLSPRLSMDVTPAAKLFVNCVRTLNERFGARLIIDVLRGSQSDRIRTLRLDTSDYFGALHGMTRANLQYLQDALVEGGYLEITFGDYPILKCGSRAVALLSGSEKVLAYQQETKSKPSRIASNNLPEDINSSLFEKLRQLRLEISKSRSLPPYAVCTDSTLMDMCRLKPRSTSDMLYVKGMGERRTQAYGHKFIKAIQEFEDNR